MDREKCIEYMIKGTKLVITDQVIADAQIDHLLKYSKRSSGKLARQTNLPVICVLKFRKFLRESEDQTPNPKQRDRSRW